MLGICRRKRAFPGCSRIGEKIVSKASREVEISPKSCGLPAGPTGSNITADSLEIALCPWNPCHRECQPVGSALVPPSAVARRRDDHDLCCSRALRKGIDLFAAFRFTGNGAI